MILSNQGIYEGILEAGARLAETPEAEGGWAEYFAETDEADMRIEDPILRAQTAILLENAKREMAQSLPRSVVQGRVRLDETTRSALVGGFSDYLFPIIRAGFPTNPVNELVSVQPTTRRTATVVYWNWIVGTNKGTFTQGQKLFDANTGKQTRDINFSNEVIQGEPLVALGSAGATASGTLAFHDGGGIRPGTVALSLQITTGPATVVFVDNGNGAFIGTGVTISASSINYQTGAWSITLNLETFTTSAANTATYRYDSEGSTMTPQVDVQIVTNTVQTERRALKINYSKEAMQDVMSEFGISLEPNLVAGAAEQMNYEIARQILAEIWQVAPVASSFDLKVPSGISQQEHFRDLIFNIQTASNSIWARTQKAYGNWITVDQGFATLIESLPASLFVPAPMPPSVHGLHFIGTLLNRFRVYKDLHLDKEPGAAELGNMLMGYKGQNFFEAGFVWAPYQLMYTTNPLETADFLTQRGLASRYATKMVNPDMYARINLITT
jgi:hypothetical protein